MIANGFVLAVAPPEMFFLMGWPCLGGRGVVRSWGSTKGWRCWYSCHLSARRLLDHFKYPGCRSRIGAGSDGRRGQTSSGRGQGLLGLVNMRLETLVVVHFRLEHLGLISFRVEGRLGYPTIRPRHIPRSAARG